MKKIFTLLVAILVTFTAIAQTCLTPTNVTITNITQTSFDFSWNEINTPPATNWGVEIIVQGATPTGVPIVTAGTNPYTIAGLLPNTTYCLFIRSDCSATSTSPWTASTCATTLPTPPPPCQTPTNINFSNTTSSSADLSWTDNNSPTATLWDLEVGPLNFTPTGVPTHPGVSTNPFTVSGVASNTSMCAYIRSACSGTNVSPWSAAPVCFTSNAPTANTDVKSIDNYFDIFPNPTSGNFSIRINKKSSINQIDIVDISGKVIERFNVSKMNMETIAVKDLSPGVYFCKIQSNDNKYAWEKIVVR